MDAAFVALILLVALLALDLPSLCFGRDARRVVAGRQGRSGR